jgi:puromycin-sensitive aminopeptidase
MSTYLLAFVIGEFDYIEDTDKNGKLIRVYAPVGKKEFGRFALDVSFFGINVNWLQKKKN